MAEASDCKLEPQHVIKFIVSSHYKLRGSWWLKFGRGGGIEAEYLGMVRMGEFSTVRISYLGHF